MRPVNPVSLAVATRDKRTQTYALTIQSVGPWFQTEGVKSAGVYHLQRHLQILPAVASWR